MLSSHTRCRRRLSLDKLVIPADDDSELLKDRYLNRRGGLVLVGPSGVGKSSLILQMLMLWGLGLPAFGLRPARPLRVLLIQAENDNVDLIQVRDGVAGALGWDEGTYLHACANVVVHTEKNFNGEDFINYVVVPLVEKHRPDLVLIDPFLSFVGGDVNSQDVVGRFLRAGLNPLLAKYVCAAIIVHHVSKAAIERSGQSLGQMAYIGSGSSELTNWPRAILALRESDEPGTFELIAAKRGARLGWVDTAGNPTQTKTLAHSRRQDLIHWAELESAPPPAPPSPTEVVLSLIPNGEAIEKSDLILKCAANSIGQQRARELIKQMIAQGTLIEASVKRNGARPQIMVCRAPRDVPADAVVVNDPVPPSPGAIINNNPAETTPVEQLHEKVSRVAEAVVVNDTASPSPGAINNNNPAGTTKQDDKSKGGWEPE